MSNLRHTYLFIYNKYFIQDVHLAYIHNLSFFVGIDDADINPNKGEYQVLIGYVDKKID